MAERATTMHRALKILAAVAAFSAGTGLARASEPGPDALPISVIAVQTNDADDQADALSKALRGAVRAAPGWSLAQGDYSLEVLALSLKCAEPPDADCQSRIADQIKTDRYIWGTISKHSGNVRGALHMWVRGRGTADANIEYSANLTEANDEALRRVATDAVAQLTSGPPKGTLHVRAGSVAGQVFLDGQPIGALKSGDGSFLVPMGPHRVTVKAIDYLDVEGRITINARGTAELSLTMVLDTSGKGLPPRFWGGIGAVGLGAVAGVTGIVSSVQVNNVMNDPAYVQYRQQNPQSSDVCATAAQAGRTDISNLCGTGKTFQAMQVIFYPLAAVSTGVGIYLLATARKPAPKSGGLQVNPQVGLRSASIDLSYEW